MVSINTSTMLTAFLAEKADKCSMVTDKIMWYILFAWSAKQAGLIYTGY